MTVIRAESGLKFVPRNPDHTGLAAAKSGLIWPIWPQLHGIASERPPPPLQDICRRGTPALQNPLADFRVPRANPGHRAPRLLRLHNVVIIVFVVVVVGVAGVVQAAATLPNQYGPVYMGGSSARRVRGKEKFALSPHGPQKARAVGRHAAAV